MPRCLPEDEEMALIVSAKAGDLDAQQRLLLLHEPFLKHVAAKMAKRSSNLDYDDLLMAARYGLLHALSKYDASKVSATTGKHIRFLSYAGNWIRNYVRREAERSNLIWVPTYVRHTDRGNTKGRRQDADRAWNIMPMEMIGRGAGCESSWEPASRGEPSGYHGDDAEILHECLVALAEHDPKLWRIIEGRFFRGLTLEQVGKELGVTKEAVRQMQDRAIKKLRKAWLVVVQGKCGA